MRMIIIIFAVTLSLFPTASTGNEPSAREPMVVIDSHRLPAPRDIHASFKGRDDAGNSYLVRFHTIPATNKLMVDASLGSSRLGKTTLDLARYPDIELTPILGVGRDGVELIFRFGVYRGGCYANDDGRDRVTVWFFKKRRPEINVTSFANCRSE